MFFAQGFFQLGRMWRRLDFWMRRERLEKELEEELALHSGLSAEAGQAAGLPLEAADMESRRSMGNITLAREESRDWWGFVAIEDFLKDFRYALRVLIKNPAFSVVSIVSLALGIAGNTAIFSIINGLLIRPLPFAEPDHLLRITGFFPKAILALFQERSKTMEIASVSPGAEFNLTGNGPAVRVTGSETSVNLFPLLGVGLEWGRAFAAGEDRPGADGVVILSYELWRSHFAADPNILGRTITLGGVNRRVIGVMPAGFAFPSSKVRLWIPARMAPANMTDYWGGEFVPLIGRLKPGASAAQARAEIHALAENLWKAFPFPMPRHWSSDSTVISLQTDLVGEARSRLFVLLGAVGAVLLIACANVASLLLVRATARRKEIAMRAALGAGRARIVRQLLTESVALALAGGAAGLLLGWSGVSLFRSVVPSDTPAMAHIALDWNVAGFTAALSILTGLAFGIAPALNAWKLDLMETMKTGSQRSTTHKWASLRNCLMAGEIALTLVLVAAAGLLIESLFKLTTADPGFNPQRIVAVKISPNESFCAKREACIAFYSRLLGQTRGANGVVDAALANTIPLDGMLPDIPADVENQPKTADYPAPMLWVGAISPNYLRLMQIPVLAGRAFGDADAANAPAVILVTASTANHFWPGEDPIGKHIKAVNDKDWRTVVGVVADVRQFSLANRTPGSISGAIYMPYAQAVVGDQQMPAVMNLLVKTAGDEEQSQIDIRRIATEANPDIPVSVASPLNQVLQGSISGLRSTIWVFISFAAAALALAAIGVYGLLSYSVSQRTYEISVRMAIGATGGAMAGMVLKQTLRVTLAGLCVGVLASLALTRYLGSLLFGVTARDPATFAGVVLFLMVVAALAGLIPAWRAARIDPIRTLRAE
jgi:predicted permease